MSQIHPDGSGKVTVMASLMISLALVVCAIIGATTIVIVKGYGRTITVTGAAFKPIRSDFAAWEGVVSVRAPSLEAAYRSLEEDFDKVAEFLKRQGYGEQDYDVGPVRITKTFNREREITGFGLSRTVQVEQADVERISMLANEASTLIEQGVMMESRPPRYLFTGLDTLKIEMIKAATENAKLRAEQLARTTDQSVGAPTAARVGVFQIRPLHSQDVSSRGISDVTSIDKEIVSTVHIDFLIE